MTVGLRPLHPLDLDALRAIELEPANADRWRHLGRTPSPDEYERTLCVGVLEQRVITVADEPVGLVVAYNYLPRSAVAWFAAVVAGRLHGTGVAVRSCAAFVDELWALWPLRKLYASVPVTNLDQFRGLVRQCSVEARFGATSIVGRQPVDVVVLSMSRAQWAQSRLSLVARRRAAVTAFPPSPLTGALP